MKRTALALLAAASLAVACKDEGQTTQASAIPPPGLAGDPNAKPAAPGLPGSMPAHGALAPGAASQPAAAGTGAASQPAGAGAASQPATGSATPSGFGVAPGQGLGGEAGGTLTGTVLEAQDIAQYTYVRMKTSQGEQWAAVNKYPGLKPGDEIVVAQSVVMEQFHSPSLNKTFDKITFGMVTKGPMPKQ